MKDRASYPMNKQAAIKKIIHPSKDEITKHKKYLKNYLKKNYY